MDKQRHTRKTIRFPLEAPIAFWWADSGIKKRSEGRTHDISEAGVFVLTNTCPSAGVQIGFRILLPVVPGFGPTTRVEAAGQVLRVEQGRGSEGREGFAILTQHTLMRANNDICEQGESGDHEWQVC